MPPPRPLAALRLLAVTSTLCLAASAEAGEAPKTAVVRGGSTVSLEYTVTLRDGTPVDSNAGREALKIEQGAGQIVPGIDLALIGMRVGESKRVTVPPEVGYGRIDPTAIKKVAVSELPENARRVGAQLLAKDGTGRQQPVTVTEIGEWIATIDFNHPLAGKTLEFDVTILGVE